MFAKHVPTGEIFPVLVKEGYSEDANNIYLIGGHVKEKGLVHINFSGNIYRDRVAYTKPGFDISLYKTAHMSCLEKDIAKLPYPYYCWINECDPDVWVVIPEVNTNEQALNLLPEDC